MFCMFVPPVRVIRVIGDATMFLFVTGLAITVNELLTDLVRLLLPGAGAPFLRQGDCFRSVVHYRPLASLMVILMNFSILLHCSPLSINMPIA
ncbi:MAG: hypothetical protein C4575_10395 [Desulforudis sp.]|nr:MAG: hypothetical protein C4575_10395 [Desulforudis sp.]